MASDTTETRRATTGIRRRHERASEGVIASFLHELTEHGRPREDAVQAPRLTLLEEDPADCLLCAAA